MSKYLVLECCDEKIVCKDIEELLEAIKCFGPVCYEFEDVEEYVAHLEIRQYSDEEIANMGDVF